MAMMDRSSSRSGMPVRVLAVHTTEGGGTAKALRDATWWTGSSHAIADKAGTLLTPAQGCVPYERASWTLRSGNPWSENIELVGYAASTRALWLADEAELNACARWLADRSKARSIPLVKLTPAQYRAGGRGVIGHHDHTVGYSDGTHWDPGPNFPWDVVLAKARAYVGQVDPEDDMPFNSWPKADRDALLLQIRDDAVKPHVNFLAARIDRIDAAIATLAEVVANTAAAARPGGVDLPTVTQAVKDALGADNADLADDIVRKLGARLSTDNT